MLSRRGSINGNRGSQVKTLTATLLIVVFVFLLLTSPFLIYATTLKSLYGKENVDFVIFFYVASFLRYVNNSVKFALYCISGTTFRTELMTLFSRERRRRLSRGSFSRTESSHISFGRGSIATYIINGRGSNATYVNVGRGSITSNRQSMLITPAYSPMILELRETMFCSQT